MPSSQSIPGQPESKAHVRQQIEDEASRLLSFQTLGKRMGQLDDIIRRRVGSKILTNRELQILNDFALQASKVYFSMDAGTSEAQLGNVSENSQKKEKLVFELLKKVKKRSKMMRSYTYLSWFCVFFLSFLCNLFLKEVKSSQDDPKSYAYLLDSEMISIKNDNAHLFAVDNSIQNRIIEVLPTGSISGNNAFHDWLAGVVSDIFPQSICGNGICDADEFPGFGRFGCVSDCGRYLQRTALQIDATPAWNNQPGGVNLPQFMMGAGDNLNVQFSFNIFSETMNDYIFGNDISQPNAVADVPDGNFWLELYQTTSVFVETPIQDIYDYAQAAPGTLVGTKKTFDFQYGDPAEALAVVAQVNRQMRDYCTINNDGTSAFSSCPQRYDTNGMGNILRGMYGLKGNISIPNGMSRKTILSFPFCSLKSSDSSQDPALLSDNMCSQNFKPTLNTTSSCYNASILSTRFECTSRYPFSIWAYGLPRNVTVQQNMLSNPKTLTPFNNVIGGIVISQYRRRQSSCPITNNNLVGILTDQFSCQSVDSGDLPFGIDPMFQASSSLYNGKLKISDYYTSDECSGPNGSDDAAGKKALPFAFFPHQWGFGGLKQSSYISNKDVGVYKLFFDTRSSANQSKRLFNFMKDGMFLSDRTLTMEFEIITYNADFNLFGILTIQFNWDQGGGTFWDYQYNTAQLSPYSGLKGQLTMCFEAIFGIMLFIDIIRESRDIYLSLLREEVIHGYILKFWNWIDWAHYGLLITSIGLWISYNMYVSSLLLKASYPILKDFAAPCRVFATNPKDEYEFIDFTDKMRKLAEMKNFYTAINCLNITFFVVRILKILDFQPRMSLITRTLRSASTDLGHYFTLFALIFVGYASVGTFLLGDRIKEFQTFGSSCVELFMIFMGWEPLYRVMGKAAAQTKVNASFATFQIFYWSWIMVATFVMLNVLLAIIVDAYATVRSQMHDAPTIVHEAFTVCRESLQIMQNRMCGSEWFITDSALEKILVQQNRKCQSQKKLLDRVLQIRGNGRAVRLAGGLQVSEKDFEALLHESGSTGRSLLAKARSYLEMKAEKSNKQAADDGIEIEDDQEWRPSPAVENLIKRYGEVVPEGKDDEELLEMIRTENMKRQLAMFTSQDQIRLQVSMANDILMLLARQMLPADEIHKLETETLLKRNADGCIALDVADIIARTSFVEGSLKINILAAKRLPKLDIFTESDLYCVVILEQQGEADDQEQILQEVVGRTSTRKNDHNPIWNSEFEIRVKCNSLTKVVAVILDNDEHGEDDLIGLTAIVLSKLPLGKEVDKWYRLGNGSAPHLTKRAMVRIQVRFTADMNLNEFTCSKASLGNISTTPSSKDVCQSELRWIQRNLKTVDMSNEKLGPRVLEVILISAKHLPKRDAFFMKVDPYVKLEFIGIEYESLVRKNTYSPEWGQSFLFHVKEASDISDGLRLAVMDWDRFSRHDVVGFVELGIEMMTEILNQDIDSYHRQTYNLQRNGKVVIGNDGNISEITIGFGIKAEYTGSDPVKQDAAEIVHVESASSFGSVGIQAAYFGSDPAKQNAAEIVDVASETSSGRAEDIAPARTSLLNVDAWNSILSPKLLENKASKSSSTIPDSMFTQEDSNSNPTAVEEVHSLASLRLPQSNPFPSRPKKVNLEPETDSEDQEMFDVEEYLFNSDGDELC